MSEQFFSQSIKQISVTELAELLHSDTAAELQLLDVREAEEVAIAHLPAFAVIPLSQFATWADSLLQQLHPDVETLVICHHGIRSAQMCQWLQHQGFTNVKNIVGGIDAYSQLVDPAIPRY